MRIKFMDDAGYQWFYDGGGAVVDFVEFVCYNVVGNDTSK